ncbi:hypothetical protein [Photobacterium phosphoreum]|uniref:hypothetical protein n=1 Tax=Photobacterium phosphoreum TaxID=659 RepID=UPI0005D37B44|nr:hypothetical protein [Photobacterium phosphoreum]KJF86088.1 hypothetical protein UB41_12285 [Photobacterium phosphoreum]
MEQSNELRSSVQKVQQFHQEVLKNKEEEINEYKKQAESKDKALNTVNENNLALIEKNALLENDKSELSSQLAKLNSDILVNNDNYTRLSKLLSKARKSKSEFIKLSQVNGWFINETIKRQLPKVIYIDNDFRVAQNASIFVEMLNASNDDAWVTGCHELMIHGFSKCWSFDMADSYFSEIIKPNLQNFSADHLRDLSTVMRANGQIRDRNRAEADMKLVTAALSSKVA